MASGSAKSYREPSEDVASLHIRVNRDLVRRLDEQAHKRVVSRALLVQKAIEAMLDKLEKE